VSLIEALLLALLQGVTELFPISSLGHTVVIPALVGWNIDQAAVTFLPFVVMLHLGTAAALLVYFWREWLTILDALIRSVIRGRLSDDPEEHVAWMVVLATIPAAVLGLFFEKQLKVLFSAPAIAATFLVVNGFVLFFGERVRRRRALEASTIAVLSWREALVVGVAQCAALIPGISRSGATMVAGLVAGLDHQTSARFSFLLATPIILGAGLIEVPVLLGPEGRHMLGLALAGAIAAGIAAWLSVTFLMRYFRVGRLDPFAYYCWGFGALSLIILLLRGRT
jgi:undecaprenyl-diphosphatase